MQCLFDGHAVTGTMESPEMVRCLTPPSSFAGGRSVQLSCDGAMYAHAVTFTYRQEVRVATVHPLAGVRTGGTLVTVYGTGFLGDNAAMCRFANVAVPARFLRAGQLECISPLPAVAGYVRWRYR